MPAIPVSSIAPPSINFSAYISEFAGTALLHPLPPYPPLQAPTHKAHSLSAYTYLRYFFDLLYQELYSEHQNVRLYDMYNVPLYIHDLAASQFKLVVPGIREGCPRVAIGDMVHIRQIRTNGYNMFPPVGFTGDISLTIYELIKIIKY